MAFYKKYDNGLRLVVHQMPGTLSVSVGIAVKTGSIYETDEEDGISHFIEHMLFKGTKNRNFFEISRDFDRIGAAFNAYTSKDMTMFYMKSTTAHAAEAFDILADLFLNSIFPEEEMAKEKDVIVEEIMRSEDDPDDYCEDLLGYAMYGKRGYGRNILGPQKNVLGFTRENVFDYMAKRYVPGNIVISMAGNIDEKLADDLVEKWFGSLPAGSASEIKIEVENHRESLIQTRKEIKQAHIAIGFPAVDRDNELTDATSILSSVLGGGCSSRLYQRVREELGLAYEVGTFTPMYADTGLMIISGGFKLSKYKKAIDAIFDCIHDVKKEITEDEFIRSKEQLIASTIFNQENNLSQMLAYAKQMIYFDEVFDPDGRIKKLQDVTIDDVHRAAEQIFVDSEACYAIVGPMEEPIPKRG